jgi:predicted house-cleaning noncanonical NTP pyrophosphatase (MazG superfamily)
LALSLYEYFEDGKFCDIIEAVIGPSHYSVYRCGNWLREEITKLAKDKNKEGLGKLLQVIDNNTNYIMSKYLLGERQLLRDSELRIIKKLFYNLVDDNDDVIDIEVHRHQE